MHLTSGPLQIWVNDFGSMFLNSQLGSLLLFFMELEWFGFAEMLWPMENSVWRLMWRLWSQRKDSAGFDVHISSLLL